MDFNQVRGARSYHVHILYHLSCGIDRCQHISRWAATILQGSNCATLIKPPNDKLFNAAAGNAGSTSKVSILQHHAQAAAAQKNPGSSPVFNFNVPKEVVGLFQSHRHMTPSPAITPLPIPCSPEHLPLVHPGASVLDSVTLSEFTTCYQISDHIHTHLEEEDGFQVRRDCHLAGCCTDALEV